MYKLQRIGDKYYVQFALVVGDERIPDNWQEFNTLKEALDYIVGNEDKLKE